MPYNYSKLLGAIVENCGTRGAFADKMGISQHTISAKLNGKVAWTQPEMEKACNVLGLSTEQIPVYFYS